MPSARRRKHVTSNLRQDKTTEAKYNDDQTKSTAPSQPSPSRTQTSTPSRNTGKRDLCIVLSFFILLLTVTLGYLVHRLGFAFLLPSYFKRLNLSAAEAEREVASHTFLFVGGPHRGGTTVLWRCLREHPLISGFPDKVGTDYSEGMFLQSVYPTFGIGQENVRQLARPRGKRRSALAGSVASAHGLGAYGFNPNHHLVEVHASDTARTMLMNEWGYLWNMSRPVLLEKSPPNMVISRFLQRVFSTGKISGGAITDDSNGSSDSSALRYTTRAKFLFITRHPIANALALGKYLAGYLRASISPDIFEHVEGLPDIFEQVLHWVVSHEIMAEDMERLEHARLLRFEDFVQNPQGYLDDVIDWLQVPAAGAGAPAGGAAGEDEERGNYSPSSSVHVAPFMFETHVSKTTNHKYEAQYCEALRRFPYLVAKHRQVSAKLGERVSAFGYDLDSFQCLQKILRKDGEMNAEKLEKEHGGGGQGEPKDDRPSEI